jgi:hypothetical protein
MKDLDKEYEKAVQDLANARHMVKVIEKLIKDKERAEARVNAGLIRKKRILRFLVFMPFFLITALCFKGMIYFSCPENWAGTSKIWLWLILSITGTVIWSIILELYMECRKYIETNVVK